MLCLFNKKAVGIDIADHRIWVTRLVKSGGVFVVDTFGGVKLAPGVVIDGRIKDKEALKKSINQLMEQIKAESKCEKRIVFGLPKNQAFVHVFSDTSGNTRKEYIEKIVKKDTEESVPLEADDLYYSYKILNKTADKTSFLVVAVSKALIYEWQDFFASVGVDVQIYDLNSLATFRNLYKKLPKKPLCVIDIGGDTTSITVFNESGLRYSHAIKVAGTYFTNKIAKDLKVTTEEAEKLKIKYGMTKSSEIFTIMEKTLKPIIKTTKEIFNYTKTETGEDIEKIILVGGSSLAKGLPEYLQAIIGIPVELGQPIIAKGKSDFEYLSSIGLAMRGLEKRSKQKDPGLLPLKRELKINQKKLHKEDTNQEIESAKTRFKNIEDERKLKKQKITLLVILLIGSILLGLSFMYRSQVAQKKQIANLEKANPFNNLEKIDLQIPVAISKEEFTIDRVKGRIVELAENNLKSGEKLWLEPVMQNPNRWLIYSESDARSLLLAKIKNEVSTNFSLGEIKYLSVVGTVNENIYLLKSEVSIYTSEPLNKSLEISVPIISEKIISDVLERDLVNNSATTTVQNVNIILK